MDRESTKTFLLGTAVKITSILNIDTATTCVIKIVDPKNTTVINNVNMTNDTEKVYSYVYQSASTDTEGVYVITISVTSGGYTTVVQDKFTLNRQEPI
jgi:hypothetical protein